MSHVNARLQKLLDESGVDYQILHHRDDFRAQTTAADTDTPPVEFAKAVFVWIDGGYAVVALPATHFVSESRLARSLDAQQVRLATEYEMKDLCPDCEIGAAPPLGNLYDLPTYASPVLSRHEKITFNAGTHRDALRLSWDDYQRLSGARVVALSRHEDD